MTDIEKVTKGLECHKNGLCQIDDKIICPYWKCEKDCSKRLMADALELLKAQQPRKVVYKMNPWTNLPVSFCPNCEEAIKMYEYGHGFAKRKYCSYCGQAIEWEDGVQE